MHACQPVVGREKRRKKGHGRGHDATTTTQASRQPPSRVVVANRKMPRSSHASPSSDGIAYAQRRKQLRRAELDRPEGDDDTSPERITSSGWLVVVGATA
jgi:hypothetical protein